MNEPSAKRRKVRKGTRSCWECRRRKLACRFKDDSDITCTSCLERGTKCVSQEFVPDSAPAPERRISHRLDRLESLMEKLVDHTSLDPAMQKLPSPSGSEEASTFHCSRQGTDVFGISAAGNAQQVTILGSGEPNLGGLPPPDLHPKCVRTPARVAKFEGVARQLHALFPSQKTLDALAHQSPGAKHVLAAFYSQQDQIDGKPESILDLTRVPHVKSHPALLAKRLLQLAVCLQQLPPHVDPGELDLEKSPIETMEEWAASAAGLVTSDDDFVGCLEGLECLIFQSFYQSDSGHLRKAWMTSRRALNMAQLMGIDRKTATSIRSCDPTFDPKRQPSPAVLWFRINCSDRYLSLILGLPIGSRDNSFATDESIKSDAPHDKLSKSYAVISVQIADRNELAGAEAYALTQSIDEELEKASRQMNKIWWRLPDMAICCNSSETSIEDSSAIKLQIRHFSLLILLHLPYLLRDRDQRRYEYNRTVCMQASRDILERFLEYRKKFTTAVSGRHVDYSALVAAMTLLLGHLGKRLPAYETQRANDQCLAEKTREMMDEMGRLNNDRFCKEAADTIRELLPIVTNTAANGDGERNLHLNIPLLGTVNISSRPTPPQAQSASLMSPGPNSAECQYVDNNTVLDPPFSLSFDPPPLDYLDGTTDAMPSSYTNATAVDFNPAEWPGFTADIEDWALQGVDTTYWSMLNNSMS